MGRNASYDTHDDRARLFDGGELEDEGEEGSRLPLLLVIGLLVVAAFSGVVWLAYTQGVQRGREDAPRMLVAASGPAKQAPTNSGGSETPYKGLKIYQQPAPPEDTDAESTPPAPTPVVTPPKPAATTLAQANTRPAEDTPVQTASNSQDAGAAPAIVESIPFTSGAATKPPRQLQNGTATKPAASKPAVPKPVQQASAPAPAAAAAQNSTSAPSVALAGGTALQIGAYKSQEEAESAWKAFARQHTMVSSYASEVKKVDLGDKGTWYRLRLAGFSDKSAATAFCEKLKSDGGTCFLAR